MQADYSVELGADDPALELPWQSEDGSLRYFDLRSQPELVLNITEAQNNPDLTAFLTRMNAADFPLQTAKCDTWFSQDITPEEEIFGAHGKFAGYIDLIFVAGSSRISFEHHEWLCRTVCELLRRVPEMSGSVEFVIRRCYYHQKEAMQAGEEHTSGFCVTACVTGFEDSEDEARKHWTIALTLLQNALIQACHGIGSGKGP
ncbi:MAG TPA: hypothetical protein VKT33_07485 [Candidatus Angelobacter sp.]|nr:hypothetical protein [Candidatus Angelobacter sp.]